MKIVVNKYKFIFYITILFAMLNDVLRIPHTSLTFFRIMLPFCLFYCLKFNLKKTINILIIYVFVFFINIGQYIRFCNDSSIGLKKDLWSFLNIQFYYFCFFIIFIIVKTIYYFDKEHFIVDFWKFLKIAGWIELFFLFIRYLTVHYPVIARVLTVSNVNNYGTYMTAIIPAFLLDIMGKNNKSIQNQTFIFLAMILLFLNDCRLALIGVFIEIMLILFLFYRKKKNFARIFTRIFLLTVLCLLVYIFTADRFIYLQNLISIPVQRIIHGQRFESSNSSLFYRVNVFIISIRLIIDTKFVGIGAGNLSKILKQQLNGQIMNSWQEFESFAPHNAVMEILVEFGFIALMLYILIIVKDILLIKKKNLEVLEIYYITLFTSIWVWILAPSMIYTCYYTVIVCIYVFIATKVGSGKKC